VIVHNVKCKYERQCPDDYNSDVVAMGVCLWPWTPYPDSIPAACSTNTAGGVCSGGGRYPSKSHIVPKSLNNVQYLSSILLNMWNRGKQSVGLGLSPGEIAELRTVPGIVSSGGFDQKLLLFLYVRYDVIVAGEYALVKSQPFPPPPCKEMYAWNWYLLHELGALASWQ
jgi:hypothetical protein